MRDMTMALLYALEAPRGMKPSQFRRIVELKEQIEVSYFNDEQRDYMRSLAAMPPETKCWCAWYPKGECPACPPNLSALDKLAAACPGCGAWPTNPGTPISHRKSCGNHGDTPDA